MIWCNPEGEEHVFTFADMKTWSDKTANFLKSLGIGKGDMVMVIVRRHYQFWFIATALAKLGAVMVPATFMLKEHDLEYRLNNSEAKAVIATSVGDIADIIDNVRESCPSVESFILVNGAGGGTMKFTEEGELDVEEGALVGGVLSGPEGICAAPIDREGWIDFNTGVRNAPQDFERVQTNVYDPMLMYFSSGTSGNPKMVLHNSTYALGISRPQSIGITCDPTAFTSRSPTRAGARPCGASTMVNGSWRRASSRMTSTAFTRPRFSTS